MAEQKKTSARSGGRHSALGRGLGALIPAQMPEPQGDDPRAENPLDVFFPGRPVNGATRERGGSARELLVPKVSAKAAKSRRNDAEDSMSRGSEARSLGAGKRAISSKKRTAVPSVSKKERSASPVIGDDDPDVLTPTRKMMDAHDEIAAATPLSKRARSDQRASMNRKNRPLEGERTSEKDGQSDIESSSAEKSPLFAGVLEEAAPAPAQDEDDVSRETAKDLIPVPGATFAEIPIDYIVPNARQPREVFDEDDLAELRDSIREVGILQPIVVRPIDFSIEPSERMAMSLEEKPKARFELIMGERRLRASELAGFETVPAIIRQTEDEDLLRDALLENLHRAQLNPLEEASAYQQLMADFGATQEELAKKIARSRPQIANTLRLLKLPPTVQKKVAAQVISAGHARALLSLETTEEMELLADRIVAEGLSVRTTEELVRLGRAKAAPRPRTRRNSVTSPLGESVVSALQDAYETRVTITEGAKKGRIVIEFAGPEDLRRIADLIASRR